MQSYALRPSRDTTVAVGSSSNRCPPHAGQAVGTGPRLQRELVRACGGIEDVSVDPRQHPRHQAPEDISCRYAPDSAVWFTERRETGHRESLGYLVRNVRSREAVEGSG